MTTLRIEHEIHDYDLWKTALDGFTDVRVKAGVRAFTIRRPVDDPKYLMLDLEFDPTKRADAFATFLEQNVWSSPTSAHRGWQAYPRPGSSTRYETRS